MPNARVRYVLRTSGRVAEVRAVNLPQVGGGTRSKIGDMSRRSRSRLLKRVAALEGLDESSWVFIGLTFPFRYPDPRKAYRCLRAFYMRWSRKWGRPEGIWKREFQARGAAHFHLLVRFPAEGDLDELRSWVAVSWFECVKSGDPFHLEAGTSVSRPKTRGAIPSYVAGYVQGKGKGGKGYQERVPVCGFLPREVVAFLVGLSLPGWSVALYCEWVGTLAGVGAGRWWGMWNLRADWVEKEITRQDFWRVKRAVSRVRRVSKGPPRGTWVLSHAEGSRYSKLVGGVQGEGDV